MIPSLSYTGCLNIKLTLLNCLPFKNCETFPGNFHKYVWLKVSSIMTPKKSENSLCLSEYWPRL